MSILWDERWCHELTLISMLLPKNLRRFKGEAIKIQNMSYFDEIEKERTTRETYEILMEPVLTSIRKLCDETLKTKAVTPFEQKFQSQYTSVLGSMLDALRQPPSPDSIENVYGSVKNVRWLAFGLNQKLMQA
jgi:hypothetical protein